MKSFGQRIWNARWQIAAIVVLIAVPLLLADWHFLGALRFVDAWTYRGTLARGFGYTIGYALIAIFIGYPAGILLAIAGRARSRLVRWAVIAHVEFWRNTPLLVQLFWIHFAFPLVTGYHTNVLQSGAIAIIANVSAYYTEVARAGIDSIPSGQWDAARALGMSTPLIWRLVILPQAIRIMIPPSTNLVISILKATSVLSILGIGELMRETVRLSNHTFRVVEFYSVTALIFIIVGLVVAGLSARLERHMGALSIRRDI